MKELIRLLEYAKDCAERCEEYFYEEQDYYDGKCSAYEDMVEEIQYAINNTKNNGV